jgi:uncharacterized protein (TIGR01777 family)
LNVFNDCPLVPSLRIVIPGGSGHVGRVLARHFHAQGHDVTVLSRNTLAARNASWRVVEWNGCELGPWAREIDGADVVINLAGRRVNCRYHERNRRAILESRVYSTRAVGQAVAQSARPPAVWLNASTATIYRHALDRPMDEAHGELGGHEQNAPSTWKFSIDVATAWEREFFSTTTPRTRKIALRSAMTMSPDRGGIFSALSALVRLGLGGRTGSGRQYVSWIHEADFVRAIEFLIVREDQEGCVNVCSPNPLPYSDFMAALRRAWRVPAGLPAAKWMLGLAAFFLRTETELVLKSRRVVPGRLLRAGFEFMFPQWPEAAEDLVACWRGASNQETAKAHAPRPRASRAGCR